MLRSAVTGLGFAALAKATTCPSNSAHAPHADEPNPFSWPMVPTGFDFAYPDCWEHEYPACAGDHQSPIDVDSLCIEGEPGATGSLYERALYKIIPGRPKVFVSKFMRAASIHGDIGSLSLKDAMGFDTDYEASQIYLTADSAHTMDGQSMDAELMIVHTPKGETESSATRHSSVIVSVFFREGEGSSDIFSQMGFSSDEGSAVDDAAGPEWQAPSSINLPSIMPAFLGDYMSYDGSIPAPPCNENVHYIILNKTLSATPSQVRKLKDILNQQAGGYKKRPPVRGSTPGACVTTLSQNSIEVPAAKSRSSGCHVRPDDITAAAAYPPSTTGEVEFKYEPTDHVKVEPQHYSIDATGHFGGIFVNGRYFEATTIHVKPVSHHFVDGEHTAAEILIEHFPFGSAGGAGAHHRRLDMHTTGEDVHSAGAHGDAAHHADPHEGGHADTEHGEAGHDAHGEEGHDAHAASHGAGVESVMLSIPLKMGKESPLLRKLGLGHPMKLKVLQDEHSYDVHETVDLNAELGSALQGQYYFYKGGHWQPSKCGSNMEWIVLPTMEVSLDQINSLVPTISGLEYMEAVSYNTANTWLYSGVPEDAGSLGAAPAAGDCATPIDVQTLQAVPGEKTDVFISKTSWKPVSHLRLQNSGSDLRFETTQIGYLSQTGPNGFPNFYQVTSVHLKMPSEHFIDGKQYPAELQVVHKNQKTVLEFEDDNTLTASFLFELGDESKLLKQFLPNQSMPESGGYTVVEKPVDLMWALGPAMDQSFYHYESQCGGQAQFVVFETPLTLSQEQIDRYRHAFPGHVSTRPLKPIGARQVMKDKFEFNQLVDYRFFLNRDTARNKATTPVGYIAFPIIGTLTLCSIMMTALFQREDARVRRASSGGLYDEPKAMEIGKHGGHV